MTSSISSGRHSVHEHFYDAQESFDTADNASSRHHSDNASANSLDPHFTPDSARSSLDLPPGTSGVHIVGGAAYQHLNQAALHRKLESLFTAHMDGENSAEFHSLIESRVRELHTLGETPESVEAILSKGVNFNRTSQLGRGAIRALPFAAASLAFDNIPLLSAFASHPGLIGMNAGLQSSIADTFGCALLDRMSDDVMWMHAKPEEMAPVMQHAAEKRQPSELRLSAEYGLAIQSYSARNIIRLGTAAAVTATHGAEVAANVDSKLSAIGGVFAGAAMGVTTYEIDRAKGRTGPEYLFARLDWKEHYLDLKAATVLSGPVMGAVKRTAKLPLDIITDTPRALRALASAGGIGKTAALSAGFGGVTWGRAAVRAAMGSSTHNAASLQAISHLVNIAGSSLVYGAVPGIEIMGDKVGDKISDAVHHAPAALGSAAGWAAQQAQKQLNMKLLKTS